MGKEPNTMAKFALGLLLVASSACSSLSVFEKNYPSASTEPVSRLDGTYRNHSENEGEPSRLWGFLGGGASEESDKVSIVATGRRLQAELVRDGKVVDTKTVTFVNHGTHVGLGSKRGVDVKPNGIGWAKFRTGISRDGEELIVAWDAKASVMMLFIFPIGGEGGSEVKFERIASSR
jgi:hypothetical protein